MWDEKRRQRWVFMVASLCGIGGILYGYDIGVIAGALVFIQKVIPMTPVELGIVVGAVFFGGLLGTLISGPMADRYGRRLTIMFSCVLFALGLAFVILAQDFLMLLLARLLLGVAIGVVAVAVPLYVSELVPAETRGRYVTFFQLFLTFGIMLAYFIGLLLTPGGHWRLMFAVLFVPAVILFVGIVKLPESPRWLMIMGQKEKARQVLQFTYSTQQAEVEMQEMAKSTQAKSLRWRELMAHIPYRALCIAVSVAILTQGTGINAILQYAPVLLKASGMSSNLVSMMGSLGIGALNFIVTIIAVLMVDRVGRRSLLIIGTAGMLLSNILLSMLHGASFFSNHQEQLALIGLMSFIVFYALGPGVVVWLAISELFPTIARGKGMAICLFFNSLAGTVMTSMLPSFVGALGISALYVLCGFFNLCYLLVAIFFLPETRGRTLEQIQQDFSQKKTENSKIGREIQVG